ANKDASKEASKDANKDANKDAKNMGAAATSDVPPKAGEASTSVQGKPNADPNMPAATKDSKKEAQNIMGAAPATSSAAPAAASAAGKTRAEVIAELMGRRAAFDAERRAMRGQ